MNVLQIISGGETGGSKKHLISLSCELLKRNINNEIVCFIEGTLSNEAVSNGLNIEVIKQKSRMDMSIIDKLYDICVRNSIDIINCHGGRANFIGMKLKKRYNAKYVTTIHSDYMNDYKGNIYKSLIYSNINRVMLKKFDDFITVSDDFKDMLVKRGFNKDKIYVIYNGVDFDIPNEAKTRESIIKKYNLNRCGHYVSMVARLHPIKGHKVFDACAKVLKKIKDVNFLILGSGPIEDELKDYVKQLGIQDNVTFLGFVAPKDFYFISDFTVLNSFSESFPLSILESASYKKAVISTDVGGINKLIEDDVNGFLVKPGDDNTLSQKMIELLENSEMCKKFGMKLYDKAKDNYSVQKFADNYINIYNSILGGK